MDDEIKGLSHTTIEKKILCYYTDYEKVAYGLLVDAQHFETTMAFMRIVAKILVNLSKYNPISTETNAIIVDDIHGVNGKSCVELSQNEEKVRIRFIRRFSSDYEVTFEQLIFLLDNQICCLHPIRLNYAYMSCGKCEMCISQ